MDDPLSWVVIGLCIVFHFFFSSSETSFACVNRYKMQVKADDGKRTAKLVLKVCDKYDRALTTVLIGSNIVAILASSVSTILFYNMFRNSGLTSDTISLISSIIISFAIYILGDSLPKTIAKAIPDTLSYIYAYPVYGLMILLFPISFAFEKLAKGIEKIFKVKNEETITEDDLETAIEKVSDDGIIEEEQSEIIQSALDFADTNVKEVLTPKEKIFALNIRELDHEKLKEILIKTDYSRIPVYDTAFDNLIGILHVKTYVNAYLHNPKVSIRKSLQKPYFVSTSIMIDDIFNGFKKHHTHIAIVRDRNKHIVGMVTMDDVLEELVSDISEPNIQKRVR